MITTTSPMTSTPAGPLLYDDCASVAGQAVVGVIMPREPTLNDVAHRSVRFYVPAWEEPFPVTSSGIFGYLGVDVPTDRYERNSTADSIERELLCVSELAHAFARRVRNAENERLEDDMDSMFTSYISESAVNYDPMVVIAKERVVRQMGNAHETGEELLRQFGLIERAPSRERRLQVLKDSLDSPDPTIRYAAGLSLSFLDDPSALSALETVYESETKGWSENNFTWVIDQFPDSINATIPKRSTATTITFEQPESEMLLASLEELREAPERAEDDDWPIPTSEHLERTERLLRRMFDAEPHPYWIYPTSSREMVIDAGDDDLRVIVKLFHDGRVIYTFRDTVSGKLRAIRHPDAESLPDHEMRKVLNRLSSGCGQA